jgi:hypothetical protein
MLCEANMKLWHLSLIAAALTFAAMAAPKAHAFTMDNTSNANGDGSAKYVDPDSKFSGSSNGSTTTRQFGNTTLQLGTHNGGLSNPSDDRDRMFLQPNQPGSTFDSR